MLLRKFENKDRKQVITLIGKILYEIFKAKPKGVELGKGLFKKGGVLYVAEEKGKIIGTIGIRKQIGRTARLKKMYIEKSYRGTGLAQKLYNTIESFAKKKRYRKIILSTTPEMKAAIKFYKKQGFVEYMCNKRKNQIFSYKKL